MSAALASGFFTAEPPGKSYTKNLYNFFVLAKKQTIQFKKSVKDMNKHFSKEKFILKSTVSFFVWLTSLNMIISQIRSDHSLSRVRLFATPWITARQASLSITNSRSSPKLMSSSRWCHPAISSSVVPFSSCPQSLPASGSFPMSQLFAWGGQILEFQLPHESFQWTPRTDLL